MTGSKNIKLKVLFIVFLAVSSFVFFNQADAQTTPNFSRDYTWSGGGGDWERVTFDLNTELASPNWQKINSNAQIRIDSERFIDSNNDSLYDQFSFERYAINTTTVTVPGCDNNCPPLVQCVCQPVFPDNLGQLICTDPWGNNTGPTCSIIDIVDTPYDWSATYKITGIVSLPATPSGFQITGTGANCSLNLSWNDLRNEDSYEIERSVDGFNFSLIVSHGMNTTSWNNGVSPDNAYSYRIRARNVAGVSSWSPTIRSKQIFCRTYIQYGIGGWNNYSLGIGEELLQWGASWNLIRAVNSPEIDYNSTGLLNTNSNNYLDTFSARIRSSYECRTDISCIQVPDPIGNIIPLCSTFNPGTWNNDNDCIGFDPCSRINPCWPFSCWITVCVPPPPIIPNSVDRPFLIEYSVQGFRAAYVDLKINNLDGLNLEVPDTQADASWISENTILPCVAATIINGQQSNLWSGGKSTFTGSEDLGTLERGQENAGYGRQYSFSLVCDNIFGNPPKVSDIVNVGVWKFPIIDNFNCDDYSIVPPQAANCNIGVRNADYGCVVSGGSFSQQVCLNESECLNDSVSLRPSQTTNFTLTCLAIDGNASNSKTITVNGSGDGGDMCGNGVINSGEQCDDSDLGGESCSSLGFSGGTLSCNSNCTFNTSACGGGGGGGGFLNFFKNIIWREIIPR